MNIKSAYAAIAAAMAFVCMAPAPAAAQSDSQLRQRIVRQSVAAYPGNCPCPYSIARNGSHCGGRSAYNRRGGHAPLCYPSDVSSADIARHRR